MKPVKRMRCAASGLSQRYPVSMADLSKVYTTLVRARDPGNVTHGNRLAFDSRIDTAR